jgi:hypothetical protein
MEKNKIGGYYLYLPRKKGEFECKFTRGSWSTEEVDQWGFRIPNRKYSYEQDTVFVEIENWRDLTHPDGPPVRVVLESIPEDTPSNDDLYIAGNFNNWNPGNGRYTLDKATDGTYYVDIPRDEYMLEFKITRGDWGTVECRPDGEDIENRVYAYRDVQEIRIVVERWKDR